MFELSGTMSEITVYFKHEMIGIGTSNKVDLRINRVRINRVRINRVRINRARPLHTEEFKSN